MQTVANAIFQLPFDVHFRTRGSAPLIFECRACKFVVHLPEAVTRGPSMTTKDGDEAWSTSTVSVEIACDFGDPCFSESAISDRATVLVRSFLDVFRWRTRQPQIGPSMIRNPSSVQYFDRDRVDPSRPLSGNHAVLIVGSIVGGALISPPSGAVLQFFSTLPDIADPFPPAFCARIVADLDSGTNIPLWDDYILSARRVGAMPRKVMDLGIAAEVFIDQYLDRYMPNWERKVKRPANKQDGVLSKIELGYRHAILQVKGRDIEAEMPAAYEHVRYLYRARNSAGHAGVAEFSDDAKIKHLVTDAHFKSFHSGLVECIQWVEGLP